MNRLPVGSAKRMMRSVKFARPFTMHQFTAASYVSNHGLDEYDSTCALRHFYCAEAYDDYPRLFIEAPFHRDLRRLGQLLRAPQSWHGDGSVRACTCTSCDIKNSIVKRDCAKQPIPTAGLVHVLISSPICVIWRKLRLDMFSFPTSAEEPRQLRPTRHLKTLNLFIDCDGRAFLV